MHEEQNNAPVKTVRSNRQEANFPNLEERKPKTVLFSPITTTMPYCISRSFGITTSGGRYTTKNQTFY